MFAKLENYLYKLLKVFIESLVLVLVILVGSQILSRQIGINWMAPPDEIVVLVFAWLAFIGAALLVRDNQHLRAGVLDTFFEKKPQFNKIYLILVNLLVLVFEVVMFRSSLTLFQLGMMKTSPQLQWSETIWYFPVLASAFLMLFYTIIELVKIIFKNNYKTEASQNVINNI